MTAPRKFIITLICLLWAVPQGAAQDWLRVQPLEWESVFEFDGSWRRSERTGAFTDNEFEESVRLRQGGFLWDPKIATFFSELQPVLKQRWEGSPGRQETTFGQFLRANGNISLLHGTTSPVSFFLQGLRDTGTTDGDLGSRTDFDTLIGNASVNLRTPYFPSTLKYSERRQRQSFQSGFNRPGSERNDILRTLSFRGRSSKMELFLEHDRFDDLIKDQNQDFVSNRAQLSHTFRWGKGSRLNSRVDFFDRDLFNAQERLSVDERVLIQHTENLASTTSYNYSSQTLTQNTVTQNGTFALNHQLYRNLTTSFNASGNLVDTETSEETQYQATLDLSYRKKIPWEGTFSAGIGGGYGVTDRKTLGGLLDAIDENHVIPADRNVVLNSQLISTDTIIVTNAAGDFVFTEGTDYTVVSVANNLTELRIIAGGQINVGDTILVDYQFASLPSQKFSRVPFKYRVGLDFEWLSLFHRESRLSESLISGVGQNVLKDQRQRATGAELKWITPETRATFGVENRFNALGDFKTDSLSFKQSLVHNWSPTLTMSLRANQDFRKSGGLKTDFYSADASLSWRPWPSLSVRPRVGFWSRKQELQGDERFITGGFDLRWFWRKIEARLRYGHDQNTVNDNETIEDRVLLTITRRF